MEMHSSVYQHLHVAAGDILFKHLDNLEKERKTGYIYIQSAVAQSVEGYTGERRVTNPSLTAGGVTVM